MAESSESACESGSSNRTGDNTLTFLKNKDEQIGALHDFAAAPPGYEDEIKPGILIFNSNFESGNLGRVDYVSSIEYDLFIRPDTCNPRLRVWFNFTVSNALPGQRLIFNIVNFSKTKSLYREGMSPLVMSTTRPKWQRLPAKNVFYYKSPDHRQNYVMSFAFAFDIEDEIYQFSYCYPYAYSHLQTYLDSLERKQLDCLKREQLCLSVQQRRVDLVTITSKENQRSNTKKRVVFVTSRIHPGETPSSFVCQGMIDFLISNHPTAKVLRDYLVFKFVPMLNPDGVVLGNYRSSLMGFDLNRYWLDPSNWAHPTIVATKKLLMSMDADPGISLDFYIDLHAHSTMMNGFMYGNVYDDGERHERQAVFPKLLCFNAEDFSLSSTSFNRDTVKAGTGRRALGSCLSPQTNCYTLEVSFFSYTSGLMGTLPYTQEGYFKLGRNVARTFLDYYRLNSLVANRIRQDINITFKENQQLPSTKTQENAKNKQTRKSSKGRRKSSTRKISSDSSSSSTFQNVSSSYKESKQPK